MESNSTAFLIKKNCATALAGHRAAILFNRKLWRSAMNKIGTKIIDTERCILRRIVPDDYQMMYENWAKYEEVCRYFPFNPVTDMEIYKEKVHKWADNYESDTYFHWVIEWKENHD